MATDTLLDIASCTMANEHQQALLTQVAAVMKSEKYSDFIIKCEDRQWKVHKAIVGTASPVLAAEIDRRMKEGLSGVTD